MKSILIIEDDPAIQRGLKHILEEEAYNVSCEDNGQKGFEKAKKELFDLILLDLMLPDKEGTDICKDLRKEGVKTPIIMVTSRSSEIDKVIGLEVGADDYITKPFSLSELLARIKAVLRRTGSSDINEDEATFGNAVLNFKKQEIKKNGKTLTLPSTEFKILKYFLEHEGEVISRFDFLDDIWGYDSYPTTRTVDNYILSLRKIIEDDPSNPKHLLTVYKSGYKFVK